MTIPASLKICNKLGRIKLDNNQSITPSSYSEWHRTLGPEYTAHDIDFVELRHDRGIVGIFSVTGNLNDKNHLENSKGYICNRSSFKMEVQSMRELSSLNRYKAYYVLYTKDMSVFDVWNVNESKEPKWKRMDQDQYNNFIKGL